MSTRRGQPHEAMSPNPDTLAELDDVLGDPRVTVIDGWAVCVLCSSRIVPTAAVGIAAHGIREDLSRWCAALP